MVGHRIKGLALHCLIIRLCEATQGQDVPLMDKGQGRSKPSRFHLFLLDNLHVHIDLEAVFKHLILTVLLVAMEPTNDIDVSIEGLERFRLDGDLD